MGAGHSHAGDLKHGTSNKLILSLAITLFFVIFEAVAGFWANSLALITDAAHNVTDVIALGLSWYALRLASKPASPSKTFGYHRAGILIAMINSTTLVIISLGIFYEAYHRFITPTKVESNILIGVGIVAFVVNAATAWLVKSGSENDLNLRSAFLHLMGDVVSTIGAVIAGIVIAFTGLNWLDPAVSVLIGILILVSGWVILRESLDILMEATPQDLNTDTIISKLMQVNGVKGVHDLHVWSITQEMRLLSAHILTDDIPLSAGASIQREINEILKQQYKIAHTTLQLESPESLGCEPDGLFCDMREIERDKGHHDHK